MFKSTPIVSRAALIAVICLLALPAAASSTSTSRLVTQIHIDSTQYGYVKLNGATVTGRPTCHQVWFATDYMFDITTNHGKAILSVLTSAYLAGKKIYIQGSGACVTSSPNLNTMETITSVRLSD